MPKKQLPSWLLRLIGAARPSQDDAETSDTAAGSEYSSSESIASASPDDAMKSLATTPRWRRMLFGQRSVGDNLTPEKILKLAKVQDEKVVAEIFADRGFFGGRDYKNDLLHHADFVLQFANNSAQGVYVRNELSKPQNHTFKNNLYQRLKATQILTLLSNLKKEQATIQSSAIKDITTNPKVWNKLDAAQKLQAMHIIRGINAALLPRDCEGQQIENTRLVIANPTLLGSGSEFNTQAADEMRETLANQAYFNQIINPQSFWRKLFGRVDRDLVTLKKLGIIITPAPPPPAAVMEDEEDFVEAAAHRDAEDLPARYDRIAELLKQCAERGETPRLTPAELAVNIQEQVITSATVTPPLQTENKGQRYYHFQRQMQQGQTYLFLHPASDTDKILLNGFAKGTEPLSDALQNAKTLTAGLQNATVFIPVAETERGHWTLLKLQMGHGQVIKADWHDPKTKMGPPTNTETLRIFREAFPNIDVTQTYHTDKQPLTDTTRCGYFVTDIITDEIQKDLNPTQSRRPSAGKPDAAASALPTAGLFATQKTVKEQGERPAPNADRPRPVSP